MEENILIEYRKTGDILKDTEAIVEAASRAARTTVNVLLVQRNWLIGKRISEEEMAADGRAEYGMEVIKSCPRNLLRNMDADIQRVIFTAFMPSIKPSQRFSNQ